MLPAVRDFTEGGINIIRAHLPSDLDDLAIIASVRTRPNGYSQFILSRRSLRSSLDCSSSASCFTSPLRMRYSDESLPVRKSSRCQSAFTKSQCALSHASSTPTCRREVQETRRRKLISRTALRQSSSKYNAQYPGLHIPIPTSPHRLGGGGCPKPPPKGVCRRKASSCSCCRLLDCSSKCLRS